MAVIVEKEALEKIITLDKEIINCIENAFYLLATKDVVMPPIMRLDIIQNNGEIDIKSAYVPGIESFVVKISPGFFDNPKLGLPSINGLMVLFSAKTGLVEAVLLDQGYLTMLRTAAAGGVAIRWLSNTDDAAVTIIGTGEQARQQLIAASLERKIKKVFVWGRSKDKIDDFITDMQKILNIKITACTSVFDAVQKAQIIITTTPSREPLISSDMLKKGQTIVAMGSDSEHKQEIEAEVFKKIDKYICDSQKQTSLLGELHHSIDAGYVNRSQKFTELGEVISKRKVGRETKDEIILCDLTGTGVQDTAIAALAYEKLKR